MEDRWLRHPASCADALPESGCQSLIILADADTHPGAVIFLRALTAAVFPRNQGKHDE
ncbi:MAG: hypothetical protein UZ16_OP3001000404 [Candidatus Hinthialibacteria bacterium OLB16]|nr:MAG: hypothetical protein UZ16_OP3001000404 [Candidatus Hinthialibacteria bacterium OLB16]